MDVIINHDTTQTLYFVFIIIIKNMFNKITLKICLFDLIFKV